MFDFVFTLAVLSLAVWGVMDVYFYSILFQPLRDFGEKRIESTHWPRRVFGYGLNCRFCLSHWVTLLLLVVVMNSPGCLAHNVTITDAILLLFITPRLSLVLHDHVLRPLTYEDSYGKDPDGE